MGTLLVDLCPSYGAHAGKYIANFFHDPPCKFRNKVLGITVVSLNYIRVEDKDCVEDDNKNQEDAEEEKGHEAEYFVAGADRNEIFIFNDIEKRPILLPLSRKRCLFKLLKNFEQWRNKL